MFKLRVKICGIRTAEIAQQAAQAGADFMGLVFHPDSKRYVTLEQAKIIAAAVKAKGAIPVAVFVNHSAAEMHEICEKTAITWIQLHGSDAKQQHHLLPAHYQRIYVQSVTAKGEIPFDNESGLIHCNPARDFLLFDTAQPGSGKKFDWQLFNYQGKFRWFLAGGLTPDNVVAALKQLKPAGVDVSSGVENAAGEKDITLVRKFINSCHAFSPLQRERPTRRSLGG